MVGVPPTGVWKSNIVQLLSWVDFCAPVDVMEWQKGHNTIVVARVRLPTMGVPKCATDQLSFTAERTTSTEVVRTRYDLS